MEEVARYLVGEAKDRKVKYVRVPLNKKIDIDVLTPVDDLINDKNAYVNMYKLLSNLIEEHKTTLIFTNKRFISAAMSLSSNDSCAMTWHQWQAE